MSALPDSIRWYATLLILTWSFAPLARVVAGRLPDRGAFIAKPVGLLATIWPIWFLAGISPIPYSTAALWITAALAALIGWVWLYRARAIDRSWLLHLVVAELIALIAFVGLLGLRGYTPEIAGTEKPMDIALMSASARATNMPPSDPWMAGQSINYYYVGYLMHGSLARMSSVPTWVGFNLALASTFAMTITAAAGLGYNVVRARAGKALGIAAGAVAAFLIPIAGNLHTPVEFLRDPSRVWHTFWWQSIGWQSSRVVVDHGAQVEDTINEFPSFSFILGDLHPHVMALPFTLVALTIAMGFLGKRDWGVGIGARGRWAGARDDDSGDGSWVMGDGSSGSELLIPNPQSPIPSPWPLAPRSLVPVALGGAIIGALYPLNSWDYPTYMAAAAVALFFAAGWTRETLVRVIVLGVASIVAWAPFWVTFVPFAGGGEQSTSSVKDVPVLGRIADTVAAYRGERTSAGEFFTIFGLFWAVAVVILAVEAVGLARSRQLWVPKSAVAGAVILALIALAWPAPVLLLAGLPLAVSLWLIAERDDDIERTAIATLFAAGFGLIILTEFIYIQDVFHGRLNTLFKVYYQVWTLFGIATAIAFIRLWRLASSKPAFRGLLSAGMVVIVLAGVSYPIISAKTWTEWQGPRAWDGLNGADYIAKDSADDLAAIEWLSDHAEDNDVVLEMPGCSYEVNGGVPTSRISAFTGIPTVIGWTGHEGQWRGGQSDLLNSIGGRADDANALYANPQDTALLNKYKVTLLYVGTFEQDGTNDPRCENGNYPSVSQPGYPGAGWSEIFSSGSAHIYRRTA